MPAGKDKGGLFKFKQFDVDQSGCAMKINTDGVLLGALADADDPKNILDIGTGTGVIAVMLAQRFPKAKIDAVEIDVSAAATAGRNFANSPFASRLAAYSLGFEQFFESHPEKKYDLIVSNPPFYINSLKSPKKSIEIAKHADKDFFERLIIAVAGHLTNAGRLCMILPVDTAELVLEHGQRNRLFPLNSVNISSFSNSEPHRVILSLGFDQATTTESALSIFETPGVYSEEYIKLLKPYFIIF